MVTPVRFWIRRSNPAQGAGTAAAARPEGPHSLRCERCDVTWRGPSSVPCWCCGAPGDIRGEVRIFAD